MFRSSKNQGAIFPEKQTALSTPGRCSGLPEMVFRLIWTRISDLDQPPWRCLKGLVQIPSCGSGSRSSSWGYQFGGLWTMSFLSGPGQDFLGWAGPRFSGPGRAINLRVPGSVPCPGVPVQRCSLVQSLLAKPGWYDVFKALLDNDKSSEPLQVGRPFSHP